MIENDWMILDYYDNDSLHTYTHDEEKNENDNYKIIFKSHEKLRKKEKFSKEKNLKQNKKRKKHQLIKNNK